MYEVVLEFVTDKPSQLSSQEQVFVIQHRGLEVWDDKRIIGGQSVNSQQLAGGGGWTKAKYGQLGGNWVEVRTSDGERTRDGEKCLITASMLLLLCGSHARRCVTLNADTLLSFKVTTVTHLSTCVA